MSPPVQIFLTTIAMQPVLRQRQEYILRILQAKRIPFTSYDVASDEKAKRLWRRKVPGGKGELPGILVGGTCPGTFQDFEEAVEFAELDQFLRLKEEWNAELAEELAPSLPQQAIAVPGAHLPSQTQPLNSSTSSRLGVPDGGKRKPRTSDQFEQDLEMLNVTDDQISELLESLGLEEKGKGEEQAKKEEEKPAGNKGFGALGAEAAKAAKEKAEARKTSGGTSGTAPLAVKPLALRKVSDSALAPEPEPAKEVEAKEPEPTASLAVDPAASPIKGEGEVTTGKLTEDELAPSELEAKEVQAA